MSQNTISEVVNIYSTYDIRVKKKGMWYVAKQECCKYGKIVLAPIQNIRRILFLLIKDLTNNYSVMHNLWDINLISLYLYIKVL
jgi:hypothetical protein